VNDILPNPIQHKEKLQLNHPLKFLLVILGLLLVVLLGEIVFLTVMKNKNKAFNEKKQEKTVVAEKEITPISTGKNENETLTEGKVISFEVDSRKINLILGSNIVKTVEVDDNTIFVYDKDREQVSPFQAKMVDLLTFLGELKKDDRIGYSYYEDNNHAGLVVKYIVD